MRPTTVLSVLLLTVVITGCGSETTAPTGGATDPDQLLTTGHPVTVLDDGDGAELCLGGATDTLPPQCGGPKLVGWSWAEHEGEYEDASGVRWGDFVVTGTLDGEEFTVETATVDRRDQPPSSPDVPLPSTPCPEPPGGWRVLDASKTTQQSIETAHAQALQLPGYAGAWIDQSINPALHEPDRPETAWNDPTKLVLNVQVAGDPGAAEKLLRQWWGGALCVSEAIRTERELLRIQERVQDLPDVLSSGVSTEENRLTVRVAHDEGTLQEQLDEEYGEGVVVVESLLRPAS